MGVGAEGRWEEGTRREGGRKNYGQDVNNNKYFFFLKSRLSKSVKTASSVGSA